MWQNFMALSHRQAPSHWALVQGKYVMEDGNCTFGIVRDLCNDSKDSIYQYWQ